LLNYTLGTINRSTLPSQVSDFLGNNCAVSSQIVAEFRSAEIGVEEKWTIRGLARELGVASGWVYNRIRNGFLSELDVSRKPPHGNVLIRDDAALLARLHAEVKQSRRLRRTARTASIPPDAGESNAANCAMTSRTNRTLKGAKSDI